ncbi:MAG: MazG nucleotide pyrophosphohydrolase domain-containing protein [Sulfolobales archaeon]|nr:nucleotide pyrophosphohydrolase [Sulfolobales archaeon]MDW8010928.1 MazG nucleotide pyrophosphohydrolase domain-containing protein [Sulfolobales archaeon]
MTVREAQKLMKSMFYERDSSRGLYATFTWLVEEIGELAEAILNQDRERVEEEIADVIAWTLTQANLLEVEVEEAYKKKYQHR